MYKRKIDRQLTDWMNTQSNLQRDGLYINAFHRANSMAAQREVQRMLLHPYSRQQVIEQVELLHQSAISKSSSNCN